MAKSTSPAPVQPASGNESSTSLEEQLSKRGRTSVSLPVPRLHSVTERLRTFRAIRAAVGRDRARMKQNQDKLEATLQSDQGGRQDLAQERTQAVAREPRVLWLSISR